MTEQRGKSNDFYVARRISDIAGVYCESRSQDERRRLRARLFCVIGEKAAPQRMKDEIIEQSASAY